jgi:hypothetical protein
MEMYLLKQKEKSVVFCCLFKATKEKRRISLDSERTVVCSAKTHELFRGFSYVAPLLNEDNTACNTPQVLLIRVADPDPDPGGQK